MIQTTTVGRVAGILAEVVIGSGGFIVPPKEYFQIVAESVRRAGGAAAEGRKKKRVGGGGRVGALVAARVQYHTTPLQESVEDKDAEPEKPEPGEREGDDSDAADEAKK